MPKMTDRERLAKIDSDQKKLAEEAEAVRRQLRARYGALTADIPVEQLTEREYKDVLALATKAGGAAAVAALKALPAAAA